MDSPSPQVTELVGEEGRFPDNQVWPNRPLESPPPSALASSSSYSSGVGDSTGQGPSNKAAYFWWQSPLLPHLEALLRSGVVRRPPVASELPLPAPSPVVSVGQAPAGSNEPLSGEGREATAGDDPEEDRLLMPASVKAGPALVTVLRNLDKFRRVSFRPEVERTVVMRCLVVI